MLFGDLATAFGVPNWLALLAGAGVLAAILWTWGTPTGGEASEASVA